MSTEEQGFDYIIVGGGSAGCVLANRLSADPNVSVCMLEAGPGDWNPLIHIPIGIIGLMWSKMFNWAYYTAPQKNMNGREMFWPRGKTLGGSSSINAQCYTRGNAWDYDHWAELGNRGWGFRDMLGYFRKSEKHEGGESEYHGGEGGYCVSSLRHVNPLSHTFVEAAVACGYPRNDDFGGATEEGFGLYSVAQDNGRRCSNADAFLHPVAHRKNLTVITRARAKKILVEGKRATGVTYKKGWFGGDRTLTARREVLLCGGAINSPQLLLLSGVGPAEEIEPHGIPLIHELKGVGRNLQDHLDVSVVELEKTKLSLRLSPKFLLVDAPKAAYEYFVHGRGQLVSNVAESGGFAKSDPSNQLADLQLHFIATIEQDHGHNLWNTIKHHGYTLRICDLRPKSRGRIGLKSADPMADALIDPNYLDHPDDLAQLVKAVKIGRQILQAPPLAAHRDRELEPGPDVVDDAAIETFIRERAETIYHPVGTCRMGHDDEAVVDDRLKVHGMQGLRVVDASIMPTLVGGNTNAPTTAIAEKAADMILEDAAA
ncbi:alcohol/choline dehydrogenase [Salinisphaera dokdonensis CL-ES53]|uniref:Alcohol/choline dehydrogenase n=1 Tax=Salinisphaera dokdonensis CL-ES53 TaxID=1304272 RepID=A0ABV2B174_9GAMM